MNTARHTGRAAWHPLPWLCVLLLVALAARADQAFDWQQARGVLYRVSSPVAGAPDSLVFGTIHVGSLEQLGLDRAKLAAALQSTQTLVDETGASSPWPTQFNHYRELPAGRQLADLIGPAAFTQLVAMLPTQDPARLAHLKPWVAMVLLEAAQVPPAPSVDSIVADLARIRGMRNVHLETLEDQLAALDCVPPEDYAPLLRQRLEHPEDIALETQRALAFYRHGDLPGWLADVQDPHGLDATAAAVMARARGCLLDQRNLRWSEELEPLLRTGGCFVAVGAIHLTGPRGLLASLAGKGFTITEQAW